MRFHPSGQRLAILAAVAVLLALYLADLTGMGMYGPDEPRYAAIGRAVAMTGDWVTPRLWGSPWFEKPPLLYWMSAAGFGTGLNADLAPRLPVAVLSLVFLGFFWWRLRIEWGARAASYATALLATSAGWLAYSHVAVTDLPLAALFSAALLLSLPWLARHQRGTLPAAAALLGLATLAKGLVPLVLFLPVIVLGWSRTRDWLRPLPLLAFAVCALPWYMLCTVRNGFEMLRVLILEQHFARFFSPTLQHKQPWWFYVPAFLVLAYPWFPIMLIPPGQRRDIRIKALAATVVFGFFFFSISVNKLYGYLLPLLPAAAALMGVSLSRAGSRLAMVAPATLLGALPPAAKIVPDVLAYGFRHANIAWHGVLIWMLAAGTLALLLAWIAPKYAFGTTAAAAALGFLWFQFATFPAFNSVASARPVWLASHPVCAPKLPRNMLYGLYYYAGARIPDCAVVDQETTRSVR